MDAASWGQGNQNREKKESGHPIQFFCGKFGRNAIEGFFYLNELWVAGLTIEATKGLFGRVYKTTSTLDSPCFW
jgi:hypothetical protein